MAKISLDRSNLLRSPIRLDDDPAESELPAQIPEVDLLQRTESDTRTDDGLRQFTWATIGEALPVISMEQRTIPVRDQTKLVVELTILCDGEVLDGTDLGFSYTTVAGTEMVFRVTEYAANGFRLSLKGERFL